MGGLDPKCGDLGPKWGVGLKMGGVWDPQIGRIGPEMWRSDPKIGRLGLKMKGVGPKIGGVDPKNPKVWP